MINLLEIILSVYGFVIIGYLIKKSSIIPNIYVNFFNNFSFNFLLPIALIIYFWKIHFPNLNSFGLIFAFFLSGILVFAISFYLSIKFLNYKPDYAAIFGLSSCFGNSVAFGIPFMYSILGSINSMPYMILVLFHGLVHFTYSTLIIEGYRNRKNKWINIIIQTIFGLFKNFVLLGIIIGILLNYFQLPQPNILNNYLDMFADFALTAVLISLGFALAKFKINEYINIAILLTFLKNFMHPLIAFILSKYFFDLNENLVFIVTMAAALPSGSQTYYFAFRYNSLKELTSANIVISTFTSFFTLSLLLIFFNFMQN